MTPCHPIHPIAVCPTCERYSPRLSHDAEFRPHTPCIDGTVVLNCGICPLHTPKQTRTHWTEKTEEAYS